MNQFNYNQEPAEIRVTDLFSHNLLRAMEKAGHTRSIEKTFPDYSDQEIATLRAEIAEIAEIEITIDDTIEEIKNVRDIMQSDFKKISSIN